MKQILRFFCVVIIMFVFVYNCSPVGFPKDSLILPRADSRFYPFSNSYSFDWSNLSNGKEQNLKKTSSIKWNTTPIIIDDNLADYTVNEEGKKNTSYIIIKGNRQNSDIDININGKHFLKHFNNKKMLWKRNNNNTKGYYNNNIIFIKRYNKVIIENINLIIWDPGLNSAAELNGDIAATGSTCIRLEECNNVEIRDCYFGGEARRHHIQIENCEKVFIDRVEFAGIKLKDKNQYLGGGGIKISKTDFNEEESKKPNIWNVIQNCYMHDNNAKLTDKFNWDGITTSTPGNSLIFNCYFENWGIGGDEAEGKIGADCAIDLSEPEVPVSYKDYVFRVERNIFEKCKGVKNSYTYLNDNGCSNILRKDTTVNNINKTIYRLLSVNDYDCISHMFLNNVYYNTPCWDYHSGYNVYHVNEIFIYDDDCYKKYAYKFEGSQLSPVIFKNNIIFENRQNADYHLFNVRNFFSDKGHKKDFSAIKPSDNIYIFRNQPSVWVNFVNNKQENINTLNEWKTIERFADDKNNKIGGSRMINNSQSENVFKRLIFDKEHKSDFYKSDFHLTTEYLILLSNLKSNTKRSVKKGQVLVRDYYK